MCPKMKQMITVYQMEPETPSDFQLLNFVNAQEFLDPSDARLTVTGMATNMY